MAEQRDWIGDIVKVILGGGLLTAGAWLMKVMQLKWDRKDKQDDRADARERSMVDEYRRILDDKDKEYEEERKSWREERAEIVRDKTDLSRKLQRYMIDMEAMRQKILSLNQQINSMMGVPESERRYLGDKFDPVVMTDRGGDICWANDAAGLFLGYPIEDLLSMNMSDLLPSRAQDAYRRNMEKFSSPMPRGDVIERVIRGKALLSDSSEVPVDMFMSAFGVGGKVVCRFQIRRRFERPDGADKSAAAMPVYVPTGASASGIAPALPDPDADAVQDAPLVPPDKVKKDEKASK